MRERERESEREKGKHVLHGVCPGETNERSLPEVLESVYAEVCTNAAPLGRTISVLAGRVMGKCALWGSFRHCDEEEKKGRAVAYKIHLGR